MIPLKMGNEESKLVAGIIVAERAFFVEEANMMAAHRRYLRWKEKQDEATTSRLS